LSASRLARPAASWPATGRSKCLRLGPRARPRCCADKARPGLRFALCRAAYERGPKERRSPRRTPSQEVSCTLARQSCVASSKINRPRAGPEKPLSFQKKSCAGGSTAGESLRSTRAFPVGRSPSDSCLSAANVASRAGRGAGVTRAGPVLSPSTARLCAGLAGPPRFPRAHPTAPLPGPACGLALRVCWWNPMGPDQPIGNRNKGRMVFLVRAEPHPLTKARS